MEVVSIKRILEDLEVELGLSREAESMEKKEVSKTLRKTIIEET